MAIVDIVINIFEVLPKDIANISLDLLIQAVLITGFFYFISRWFRAYILRVGLFLFGSFILLQVFQGKSFLNQFDLYAGLGLLLPHIEMVELTILILKERIGFLYEKILELILLLVSPFVWLFNIGRNILDFFKEKQAENKNQKTYEKYYRDDFKQQQKSEWEKEQTRQDQQYQKEFREQEQRREQQRQEQYKRYEEQKKQHQEERKRKQEKKTTSRWDSNSDYEILGIDENATKDEIKKAYRVLAKIYHPDLALINKEEAEEIFKKINNAYENLSS